MKLKCPDCGNEVELYHDKYIISDSMNGWVFVGIPLCKSAYTTDYLLICDATEFSWLAEKLK